MFGRNRGRKGDQHHQGTAALRRAAGAACEALERRIQLTVDIGPEDGLTDGYDHVAIFRYDGNTTAIMISPNEVPLKVFYGSFGEPIILRLGGGPDMVEIGINGSFIQIYGDGGDDFIDARYQEYPMIFWGGDGNDLIKGGYQKTTVYGEGGNDTVLGGNGKENIDGGPGNDSIDGDGGEDTIQGGDGDDIIRGGWDKDTLQGGAGNDYIVGGSEDDKLYGQDGNDTLVGSDNDGNDLMHGGNDTDRLDYSEKTIAVQITLEHSDELFTADPDGAYTDDINSNIEVVIGGAGNDFLAASQTAGKSVTLRGGAGNDSLEGSSAGDSLSGESGNDVVDGNAGNDILRGGAGIDSLFGESGDDTLFGQDDDDDLLNGGSGSDTGWLDLLPDDELNLSNVETVNRA